MTLKNFTTTGFIVLTLIVMGLLCSLGFWQLRRADEKRIMLMHSETMRHTAAIFIDPNSKQSVENYQPIFVKGTYDNHHVFFLDNQFYQHQLGYEVIQPVILSDTRIILVSRGWIKAPIDRKNLPIVIYPKGNKKIVGTAYYPSKPLSLGANVDNTNTQAWPKRIERVNIAEIRKWLGKNSKVYPFILRLNPTEPNGYIRDWSIVAMPPERHIAYAIQWFAMAGAVLIIFIVLRVCKKTKKV